MLYLLTKPPPSSPTWTLFITLTSHFLPAWKSNNLHGVSIVRMYQYLFFSINFFMHGWEDIDIPYILLGKIPIFDCFIAFYAINMYLMPKKNIVSLISNSIKWMWSGRRMTAVSPWVQRNYKRCLNEARIIMKLDITCTYQGRAV